MSNVALLTVGGLAATGLAKSAVQAVNQGLSFAAELAKSATPRESADEGPSALDQWRSDHAVRAKEFADRVRRDLEAAGIDTRVPVVLTSDGLGGIAVAGDHPQRLAIEELLDRDVLLQRDFERLADERKDLFAGDEALEPFSIAIPAAAARAVDGVR